MKEKKRKVLVAPSILSADFSRLKEEIVDVEKGGCDLIHVDVMDGQFVPNLTIGPCVVQSIRKTTKLPLDVHLMIVEPMRYLREFRDAGSDWITVHVEATKDLRKTISLAKKTGAKVGLSVRPRTPVSRLYPYLKDVDLVLIMTVEPGFGGQSFMEPMIEKVRDLRPRFSGLISVDGGINPETAKIAKEAGADIMVAGSSIFKEKDRKKMIHLLRK
ncbi:MAG: ribulose-phosphate 3-epimerase [Candidatus Omnitrophica bacterium]|nr:ribulose-phosphate 3-epimerase [Candidatus Omnitrophota bacterium]